MWKNYGAHICKSLSVKCRVSLVVGCTRQTLCKLAHTVAQFSLFYATDTAIDNHSWFIPSGL